MIQWLLSVPATTSPVTDSSWLWVRVVAYLGLLAAIAYFFTVFRKKKQFLSIQNQSGKIHITDTCPLGNRQYLVVAQYGSEKHLIGVNSNSISHLSKLESHSATNLNLKEKPDNEDS